MRLRIGYRASAEQFAPRELVEIAVAAEDHGFDSVFVSDHFQPWRHHGGHSPFSLAWMAAVGERTRRIVMGTSVLTPTFRYNPAVLAQAFATLGCLYPDRVVVGVGTGEALNEIAVGQLEWPAFGERLGRLREAVEVMRALWTGERVSFDGQYYRLVDATVYDRPDQPPPVYIAAGGPVVARYAGAAGDGLICTSGKGMDLYTDKLLPAVTEGATTAGRDPAAVDRLLDVKLSFDTDRQTALENVRFWAPLSLSAEEKHQLADPVAMSKAADDIPLDVAARRWIVSDDPDEVVEQVRPYVDAGMTHLVFHAPGHDQARFQHLFHELLEPRLRRLG